MQFLAGVMLHNEIGYWYHQCRSSSV